MASRTGTMGNADDTAGAYLRRTSGQYLTLTCQVPNAHQPVLTLRYETRFRGARKSYAATFEARNVFSLDACVGIILGIREETRIAVF